VGFDPRSWEVALWRWTSAPLGRHRSSPGRGSMLPDARSLLAGRSGDRGVCAAIWPGGRRTGGAAPGVAYVGARPLRVRRIPGASLAEPVTVRVTGPGRPARALLSWRPAWPRARGCWALSLRLLTADSHDAARSLAARGRAAAAGRGVRLCGRETCSCSRRSACRRRDSSRARDGQAPGYLGCARLGRALLAGNHSAYWQRWPCGLGCAWIR
jgi:hypothetical protein